MAETLITSSVIILMLCAIRILFKGRIRPTVQYGLWGIAAARLALPCFYPVIRWFGSLQSPWSIMNAAAPLADRLAVRAHAVTVPSGAVPVNPGQLGAVHTGLENAAANPGTALISGAEQAGLSGWIVLFLGIWIAGSILLFLWLSVVHIHMGKRLMKQRTPYEGPVPAWSGVPVYWAGDIPTPCYFVYFRKKGIYLPERLQNDPEAARHVVVHEACHAGHRDHIWGWLRCVLLCCYWINPFVWLAGYLSKRDCELSCDEAAVLRLGEAERFAYGRTLIAMAAGRRTPWNFLSTASDIGNGKKSMKERIWTLAHHPAVAPQNTHTAVFYIPADIDSVVKAAKEIHHRLRIVPGIDRGNGVLYQIINLLCVVFGCFEIFHAIRSPLFRISQHDIMCPALDNTGR